MIIIHSFKISKIIVMSENPESRSHYNQNLSNVLSLIIIKESVFLGTFINYTAYLMKQKSGKTNGNKNHLD